MKPMKANEILQKLRDVLVEDADIVKWCQETYGKQHQVYLGINNEDPPAQDKYPIIALFFASRKNSANVPVIGYSVELAVCVSDEGILKNGNSVTYIGLLRVAEFRELAEAAISKSAIGKIDISSETIEDMQFPMFSSNTIVEFEWPKSYRGPGR